MFLKSKLTWYVKLTTATVIFIRPVLCQTNCWIGVIGDNRMVGLDFSSVMSKSAAGRLSEAAESKMTVPELVPTPWFQIIQNTVKLTEQWCSSW